ncbi:HYR domain-containing protein [Marixanthomonas spongiae]|nr:HYR domain-containing protein [Marixanthomonas spongiae]
MLITVLFSSVLCAQTTDFTTNLASGSCGNTTVEFNGTASSSTTATAYTFNGGTLPSGWSASPFTVSSNTCPGQNTPDNSPYFWATDLATSGPNSGKRFVQTNAVDVSLGGSIEFYIRYGNNEGSGCEQPDAANEEVYLQYSIDNGATWVEIYGGWDTTGSGNYAWYNWYWNDIAIPPAAQTSNTLFRWYQPTNSGTAFDNWGLEDVSISATVAVTVTDWDWDFGDGNTSTAQNPTHTFASTPGTTDYTVSLTATFSDGTTNTETKTYTVYVDDTAPTATCSTTTQVIATDANNCTATLPDLSGLISATDDCSTVTIVQNPVPGTVLGAGTQQVNFTITDDNGNTTTVCPITVTIEDTTNPAVSVQDITVPLNSSGQATIAVSDIELSSSDNCAIDTKVLSKTSFDCSNLGTNSINYTVTDTNGNSTTTPVTVTIIDDEAPTARTQNLVLQLNDPNGLTITPAMVDNGSTDNCNLTLSLSQSTFDCSDIGTQNVVLTATDSDGNTHSENAAITITAPDPYVVTSAGTTQVANPTTFTTVDPSIAITYNGNADGALISVESNFSSGDELALASGYTLPSGVSANYNGNTGTLTITGTLTENQVESIFQNVQFRSSSSNTSDRSIQFTVGSSLSNPNNDHYYEYVSGSFTWTQAKADAATRTLYGLQGYLATATSVEENDFITTKLTNDGWLGGSDDFNQINQAVGSPIYANQNEAESNWYWVTGPEAGTQMSVDSTPLPQQYVNWNAGEPNNSNGNEHYMQIYFTNNGRWNDLSNSNALGYIVEYGGIAGDQDCFSFSNAKTVVLNQAPVIKAIPDVSGCPSAVFTQPITVTDVEDAPADLTVVATSNNQALVSDSNLSVSYDGTEFIVTGTPNPSVQGDAIITVTATDTAGVSSNESFTFTAEDITAPVANCVAPFTVQLDANGEASISATDIDNGSTDACGIASTTIDVTEFDCSNVGDNTVTLTVTDVNGNSSTCTTVVTVEDNVAPIANCVAPFTVQLDANGEASISATDIDNGSTDACGIASTTIDVTEFDCSNVGDNTVTLTITDVNGNSSTCTTTVTVEDNVAPVANCVAPFTVQLDANGEATISATDIDNGSSDACGIASTTIDVTEFDCSNVGDNTVTLTVTDMNGNSSTCTTVVTVEDNVAPIANCVAPFTVQLDANGEASISATDIDNGSTDACGIASTTIDVTEFDCSNVGDNTVTLTVTDVNGNSSTCTTTVTVEDNVAPVANCVAPFTVQLDANGEASISATDIDNGSTDACGIASTTIDVTEFDCSNVGDNTVTLTVTDVNGNSSTCTTTVTVEDNVAPIANCVAPFTVQLDANGEATISATDIDNGSTDACGIASTTIDVTEFDCSNVGDNTVTLTVTDVNGNSSTCTTVVTVEDNVAPVIACPADVYAETDLGDCFATVYFPTNVLAMDNCAIDTITQTGGLSAGSQFPVGTSTIEFTAVDVNGNSTVCTFDIIVEDQEAPLAVCENITVQLDEFGSASITAADIDGGSNDACGIDTIEIDQDTFDCSNVGDNTVTLSVTDVNGNESTCTAIVTVEDITAPEVVCQDITVQLDATGTVSITGMDVDGGSTDACGIASYDLDVDTFDCSNIGVNPVELTVTDTNGNTATCTAMVTVEDTIAPDLVCTDVTLELGEDGTATLLPGDVIATNDEACGIDTVAVDITEFDCTDIGTPVTVQVFVSDVNGNTSTCTALVTVVDAMAPVVSCPADQTVDPGENNLFYVVPDYFALGEASATDNCTNAVTITSQEPAAGVLLSDGVHTITLTAEDDYGNIGTCSFELTVESVLGVNGMEHLDSVHLYPNPASNHVILENPSGINLQEAVIYDLTGRVIRTIDLNGMGAQKTIDVTNLASAAYLIRISSENGSVTKQLIKE